MSTKIYEGRRLVEGIEVFELNTRLRQLLNPVRDRLDAEFLAHRSVRLIDNADFAGAARPGRPVIRAHMDFTEEQLKEDRRSLLFDPHSFSMSLGRDEHNRRVLVLPYFGHEEYRQVLDASGMFEDYGYWDNTDRPEEVTAAHWAERGEAWERVLPAFCAPIETMLTFDLNRTGFGGDS